MTAGNARRQVLIAGGGIAALELLLALRVYGGPHVEITLLTPDARFAPAPMTVAEPFARGGAKTYDWSPVTQHQSPAPTRRAHRR